MARPQAKLTVRQVQTIDRPGRHSDGGGLYLIVDKAQGRRWAFIYRDRRTGKLREMGLGGTGSISLAQARQRASDARKALAEGRDPIEERSTSEVSEAPAFSTFANQVITALEAGFRNDKHKAQWHSTIETYCKPISAKRVDQIDTEDVLEILRPIWTTKAETASRLRGRIEKILDAAKARGHRTGENPARWRGHLDHLLGKRQKLQRGHHPAMPYRDVPAFVARLRRMGSVSARALDFVILTACRSGEVLRSVRSDEIQGMRWAEVDFDAKVWTVPAVRMKAGREHRVPLTDRAIEILKAMKPLGSPFCFPGQKLSQPLSEMALELVMRRMSVKPATVHGFRSAFRDWSGEETSFPREIIEAALAHTVGDKVERAYRRGDALAKRRELMEAWARYLDAATSSNVVAMKRASS